MRRQRGAGRGIRRERRERESFQRRRRPRRNRLQETAQRRAKARLRHFRQATTVSIAFTGLLLLVFAPGEMGAGQQDESVDTAAEAVSDTLPDTVSVIRQVPLEDLQRQEAAAGPVEPDSLARQGTEEATETLRGLWLDFYGLLPKLAMSLGILLIAWILGRITHPVLRRLLHSWARADAFTALFGIAIWLLAIGVSLSVLTGDIRALVGSLGLVGLALSWALQTPIESFTGWLLNAFQGYYRVGDRIAVGEVYGDVYKIDLLTTTVWEYGGLDRLGLHVRGEQATGRLITFPNNEILTGSVINLTRDFPYVWDEVSLKFSGATDIEYLVETMRRIAVEVLGEHMTGPAREYGALLTRQGLEPWLAEEPQVFVSLTTEGWVQLTVRYLVAARHRRKWESRLVTRLMQELQTPESKARVEGALPKQQVQFLDEEGRPDTPWRGTSRES